MENSIIVTQPLEQETSEKKLSVSEMLNGNAKTGLPHWQLLPINQSREAIDNLTALLFQTYSVQQTYGDKAETIAARDRFFQELLGELPFWRVKQEFTAHIRKFPTIPTPSDILQPIEIEIQHLKLRSRYAKPE